MYKLLSLNLVVIKIYYIIMRKINKAILFINGSPPKKIPNLINYSMIGCTDGAFNYLNQYTKFLDFIIGDFDSLIYKKNCDSCNLLVRDNQNKTDFEKSLEYLLKNNITKVDVFGATGLEQDHFLGNISVAMKFIKKIQITFFDSFGYFFFAKKNNYFKVREGANISLIPIKKVFNINTNGLKYELNNKNLEFGCFIGIRNKAIKKNIHLSFNKGNLLIFIGK